VRGRDRPGEAFADALVEARRLRRRDADGGARFQRVPLAEQDDRAVDRIDRVDDDVEERPEKDVEVSALEGRGGDALERDQLSHRLVTLTGSRRDLFAAQLLALVVEIDERPHTRAEDIGIEGLE